MTMVQQDANNNDNNDNVINLDNFMNPLMNMDDEELLRYAYMSRDSATPLEIELATRLEHALDDLRRPLETIHEMVDRIDGSSDGPHP